MYLKASTYQGEPIAEAIATNIETISAVAAQAAADGSDVVLFAELFLTGYNIPPHRLKQLSISQDGQEMQEIREAATLHRIAIAVGYSEQCEGGTVFNSCILVDSSGKTVLNYRKTHLWDPYNEHERLAFIQGDSLPVGDLTICSGDVVRIGILICFDCEFPEPARVLALQGAQVLLIPTALAEGPAADSTPSVAVPGRATENNVFVVYSNLVGSAAIVNKTTTDNTCTATPTSTSTTPKASFCGQSGIFGPDGSALARASKTATGLFSAVLQSSEFDGFIQRNNYLKERRPELYTNIAS